MRGPQISFGFDCAEQLKKPNTVVKQTDGPVLPEVPLVAKQNSDLEVEKSLDHFEAYIDLLIELS